MPYYPSPFKGTTVTVRDGQFEKALRQFKNKLQDAGLLQELRARESYEKPTTERKRKSGAAKKRWERHLQSEQLPPKKY